MAQIRNKVRNRYIASVIIIFFLTMVANELFLPHTVFVGTKEIEIVPGLGSRKIGALLKQSGTIRSKWFFVTYVSLRGVASSLKPGVYTFSDHSSIFGIARLLVKGVSNEYSIFVPEGLTRQEVEKILEEKQLVLGKKFLEASGAKAVSRFKNKFEFLKDAPPQDGLEGYLFPETYRIFKNATADDVIIKMLAEFDKKLSPDLRAEIFKQKKTIFEIVTMASLIENEVVSDEDRALISGILWKRLQRGVPLQVDATLVYIKEMKQLKPGLVAEDRKINSPYNTYLNGGLPVGPISNPGLSAIKAAIYPKESPYWFYLSTPNGQTIFSETLDDHNRARDLYLKGNW